MFSPFAGTQEAGLTTASMDSHGSTAAVDKDKDPRLYYACSEGNWEEVERLIDEGVGLKFTKVRAFEAFSSS